MNRAGESVSPAARAPTWGLTRISIENALTLVEIGSWPKSDSRPTSHPFWSHKDFTFR